MDKVQRQSRRWFRILVVTIAWQAFAYGWITTASSSHATWPPADLGRNAAEAWSAQASPPLGFALQKILTRLAENSAHPAHLRVKVSAFLAFILHLSLVSLALVIAGKHASSEIAPLLGYVTAAWNPFLMSGVARLQWPELAAAVLFALSFLAALKQRWGGMWILFWAATLVHPVFLLMWPLPVGSAWRWSPRSARLTGVLTGLVAWALFAVGVGFQSFLIGLHHWWWGGRNWPDIGWNAFTFLKASGITPGAAGWVSLAVCLLMSSWLAIAFAREALSLRSFVAFAALIPWLFFWRARFLEVGLGLYWVGVWIAHRGRFYTDPLLHRPESFEPG